MNYRYFDHKLEDGGRNGLEYFQAFQDLIVETMGRISRSVPSNPNINDVTIFVHAGDQKGLTRDDWKRFANISKRRFVIFVSSHPEEFNHKNDSGGVYWLKAPLQLVVQLLSNDSTRLERFKQSCSEGNPDMSCFYLTFPKNLVAAYLLGLAFNKNPSIRTQDFPKALWSSASEEFTKYGGKEGLCLNPNTIGNQLDAIKKILTSFGQYSTC